MNLKLVFIVKELWWFPFISTQYGASIEKGLEKANIDGGLKKLLLQLSRAERDESMLVDESITKKSIELIHNAGKLSRLSKGIDISNLFILFDIFFFFNLQLDVGDEDKVISILLSQNRYQLKQVFNEYDITYKSSVEDAIAGIFVGELREAVLAISKCSQNLYLRFQ